MDSSYAMIVLGFVIFILHQTYGCAKEEPKPVEKACPHDFVLRKYGNVEMCLYFSKEKGTYERANKFCHAWGRQLFKPNTMEKFGILKAEAGLYYVGLADSNKDGFYEWSDGLGKADPHFLKKIFYQDNGMIRQSVVDSQSDRQLNSYCAVYSSFLNHLLVDSSCSSVHRFICQE